MRRKSLWKQVLAVSLSVAMLVGLPAEAVFADGKINGVDSVETVELPETPEDTEEVTESVDLMTETTEDVAEYFEYEENEDDNGDADGTVTITGYTGSDTEVVIPDEIDGKSVTGIGDYAFEWNEVLEKIEIPNSVTSIGECAFSGCESLKNIEIPNSVTSIGRCAFGSCRNLTGITLPEDLTRIEVETFSYCEKLASIEIPSSVTEIGDGAFEGCSSLTEIILPEGLIDIGERAFQECYDLTGITMSEGLVSIGNEAFSYCHELINVVIPSSVTKIGTGVFSDCNLDSIVVNVTENSTYTSEESNCIIEKDGQKLIAGCKNTVIPAGVTEIGDRAFEGCSIEDIILPESITKIGDKAFYGCSSLKTNIEISSSVINIGKGAFAGCTDLGSIVVDGQNPNYVSVGNNCIIEKESNILIAGLSDTIIPEGVTRIEEEVFFGCTGLTSIAIPDSVTSIGDGAFSASDLTSIVMPNSITYIGKGAFQACESLTSAVISSSVTNIGEQVFMDCNSLTSVTIPDSVTEMGNCSFAFGALTSIIIPDSVTSIDSTAFMGCDNVVIYCSDDSYAKQYAIENDISYQVLETSSCTHTNTEVRNAKSATCTETGYTGDTYCIDCGELISGGTAIAALGHAYTGTLTTQPTVTSEGVKTYICSRCEDTYTETIAKLNCTHTNTEVRNAKSATCTETGYTGDTYCVDCGNLISNGTATAALGHSYTESITTQPTVTS